MNLLIECFAWCMVQVTLFTAAAAGVYWLVGSQRSNRNVRLLAGCFGVIAVLTFASVSHWPRWGLSDRWQKNDLLAFSPLQYEAPPNPDMQALLGTHTEATSDDTPDHVRIVHLPSAMLPGELTLTAVDEMNRPWWHFVVWAAWIAAAIGMQRFFLGLAFVHRYRRGSRPINDNTACAEFESLRAELGAPANVALCESPSLGVAATVGWRRPIILLPAEWCAWTPDERRAVLAHELAHVAQRHFPVWIASQLTTVAHFYHPFVHWLARRLRLEQELAADHLAAQVFGDTRRYATVLAGLALGRPHPAAIVGLGLFMSRPLLMRRIAMLREPFANRRGPSRLVRSLAVLLLAAATIAVAGLRTSSTATAAEGELKIDGGTLTIQVDSEANGVATGVVGGSGVLDPKGSVHVTTTMLEDLPKVETAAASNESPTAKPLCQVTALLQVSSNRPGILNASNPYTSAAEWQIFCNTQLALFRSVFVVQAALQDQEISQLPLVKSASDPVRDILGRLDVGFAPNSEILFVSMKGTADEADQLRKLVDAVVNAYLKVAVSEEDERADAVRDALARSFSKLSDEITSKTEQTNAMARELESADLDGRARVLQELDIKRLERIDAELLRLEDEFLATKIYHDQEQAELQPKERAKLLYFEQRIADLSKRQQELEEKISSRSEKSVDLEIRSRELAQLEKIANEMSVKLEQFDVESIAPPRIRRIQPAEVSMIPQSP